VPPDLLQLVLGDDQRQRVLRLPGVVQLDAAVVGDVRDNVGVLAGEQIVAS
jgi:hypothetical protein